MINNITIAIGLALQFKVFLIRMGMAFKLGMTVMIPMVLSDPNLVTMIVMVFFRALIVMTTILTLPIPI